MLSHASHTVGENIFGSPFQKYDNNYVAIKKSFPQYGDSNIGLLSVATCIVIVLVSLLFFFFVLLSLSPLRARKRNNLVGRAITTWEAIKKKRKEDKIIYFILTN